MLADLSPEIKIMALNGAALAVAYLGIYPGYAPKTMRKMVYSDLVISGLVLLAAGALFAGSGTVFSLLLVPCNWLVFSLVTMSIMEVPIFLWFARKHDIRFDGDDG